MKDQKMSGNSTLSLNEMNTMILHFLRETGMLHSSFSFEHEAKAQWDRQLTVGRLQSLVEKGLVMEELERKSLEEFKRKNKDVLNFNKKRKSRIRNSTKEDEREEVLNLKNYVSSQLQKELQNLKKKDQEKKTKSKKEEPPKAAMAVSESVIPIKTFIEQTASDPMKQNVPFRSTKELMSRPIMFSQELISENIIKTETGSLKDIGIHLQNNALGNKTGLGYFPVPSANADNEEAFVGKGNNKSMELGSEQNLNVGEDRPFQEYDPLRRVPPRVIADSKKVTEIRNVKQTTENAEDGNKAIDDLFQPIRKQQKSSDPMSEKHNILDLLADSNSEYFKKNRTEGFICHGFKIYKQYLMSYDMKFRKLVVMDMTRKANDAEDCTLEQNSPVIYKIGDVFRTKKHQIVFDSNIIFFNSTEFLAFEYK